jgi:sugar/nucleoside kinase (ribokinase family)
MQALFIGQTYIDVTLIADKIPTGDDKDVARDYAVSFGGNAVTAAFCCAKLGIPPDLLTTLADDWLGRMFLDMASFPRGTNAPSCAPATTTICTRFRR